MKILIRYIFMVNILFFNLFTIVHAEENKENNEKKAKKIMKKKVFNLYWIIDFFL